ncbi:hypothetical protein BRADI_2g20935v3 [Brachypodium distachyon]|uniref:Uncharacterized protein n=1 Tax=Brachypodium distachyon TaxID=15368 RepID=A0A2K2D9N0_BRADI|nr:hypothetical protein BRADI_2g20935v3 [Brachypodium distachyon]
MIQKLATGVQYQSPWLTYRVWIIYLSVVLRETKLCMDKLFIFLLICMSNRQAACTHALLDPAVWVRTET